jgi:hypothetical protein
MNIPKCKQNNMRRSLTDKKTKAALKCEGFLWRISGHIENEGHQTGTGMQSQHNPPDL